MSVQKPSFLQVAVDAYVLPFLFKSFYRDYAAGLRLSPGDQVLEIGSGAGNLSRYVAERIGGGRLTCMDHSTVWMNIAMNRLKRYGNTEFILGDVVTGNVRSYHYNAVILHFVLHDLPQKARWKTLYKLADSLKGEGLLYIREPVTQEHGIPVEEIRSLAQRCRLRETSFQIENTFSGASVYSGVFAK